MFSAHILICGFVQLRVLAMNVAKIGWSAIMSYRIQGSYNTDERTQTSDHTSLATLLTPSRTRPRINVVLDKFKTTVSSVVSLTTRTAFCEPDEYPAYNLGLGPQGRALRLTYN